MLFLKRCILRRSYKLGQHCLHALSYFLNDAMRTPSFFISNDTKRSISNKDNFVVNDIFSSGLLLRKIKKLYLTIRYYLFQGICKKYQIQQKFTDIIFVLLLKFRFLEVNSEIFFTPVFPVISYSENNPISLIFALNTFLILFQELYIAKTAAATFCFYALTVTLPNVSFGLVTKNGMPKFLNIVSMAWIGIALQPIVFFATNRKFRVHAISLMCCRDPPDVETTNSLPGRSKRTSSSTSRPSRISFPDLRTLLGVFVKHQRQSLSQRERY